MRFATGKPHGLDSVHRISEGVNFSVGNKELEVDCAMKREEFFSGTCFGRGTLTTTTLGSTNASAKQFKPLRPKVMNESAQVVLPSARDSKGKGVQLEPVNLVSTTTASIVDSKGHRSFWTVNWYVALWSRESSH